MLSLFNFYALSYKNVLQFLCLLDVSYTKYLLTKI